MDRIVDLDQAAAEIESRRAAWLAAGLTVGPVTWRDETASWPRTLETDRARVLDPDSVGVQLAAADDAALMVTLFRGAWADIDFFSALTEWDAVSECPYPRDAEQFGAVLDSCVLRCFGIAR
jgi:hypothetical protein